MHEKSTRVLFMLQQLLNKKVINKIEVQDLFTIDSRTFERDIATLRSYMDHPFNGRQQMDIIYDHQVKGYTLNHSLDAKLSAQDVLALCKLMMGSRAFSKDDLDDIITRLMDQLEQEEKKQIQTMIGNERLHFMPLKHGQCLKERIFDFSQAVEETKVVKINYESANKIIRAYVIHPVGVVFSDYYFYAVSYVADNAISYPISFRLDRVKSFEVLSETFNIPYAKRFQTGDFKNKINMMYQGELIKFRFRFSGHSVEAVLDRFPISKVIEEGEGYCIIEALAYEQGLIMWLLSQGDWVKVMSPIDLVEKIKIKLEKMLKLY